jgi:hypothetical protein
MTENRTLSQGDIDAIAEAIKPHQDCIFRNEFDNEDKHVLRSIIALYNDSTTAMRKGFVGLVLLGAMALAILGGVMSFR